MPKYGRDCQIKIPNFLRKTALRAQIFEIPKIHTNLSAKHPFRGVLKISAKTNEKCKSLRLFGETRFAEYANGDIGDFV